MASQKAASELKTRVILSLNQKDARSRVKSLYKAWYRQIPHIIQMYDFPLTIRKCKLRLREEFTKHQNVCDLRVIDMMIIKGHMVLKEVTNRWSTKKNVSYYFRDIPAKKNFVAKFLDNEP